jgi:hypothetical protein
LNLELLNLEPAGEMTKVLQLECQSGGKTMREWEAFVPEEERKVYEKAGYKGKKKSASTRHC